MLIVLPGANHDACVVNLQSWVDGEAAAFGLSHCLLFSPSSQWVPGMFRMMSTKEESTFRIHLGNKLCAWAAQAIQGNLSCGFWLKVVGGRGSGRGLLSMTMHSLGPFQG